VIQQLHIRNFALIDDLVVEFGSGLNIITGETGAGTSIIIGALGLILGERARVESIRAGSEQQCVEGQFRLNPPLVELCRSMGVDTEGDSLILRREVRADGRSKASANGSPLTVSLLKRIGDALIDLHGQHQHQSLLNVDTHVEVLDQFGELEKERSLVSERFDAFVSAQKHFQTLMIRDTAMKEKEELYRFQCREIDDIHPLEGEEEELEGERRLLENSEQLYQAAEELFQQIHQSEDSVADRLGSMRHVFASMVGIDPHLNEQLVLYDSALEMLRAFSDHLLAYKERIEFDPDRLEQIRDRLGDFSRLKRKYGGSMEQVLEYRRTMGEYLSQIDGYEDRLAASQVDRSEKRNQLQEACLVLSKKRKGVARSLEKLVEDELAQLGMKRVRFRIVSSWIEDEAGVIELEQERYWADHRGMDRVEFFIAPNIGEELKPLVKIASGGEISRMMLALKSALAAQEGVPTMVFDEIDIGIGGRIAEVVGEKLKRLAGSHQIICITHLPQIASLSEEHYTVVKNVRKGRTISSITRLTEHEKVEEIARLLGGASITPIVRKHAQEMIERAAPN
jgi:DNA repair protein RecN (Recombination protein N)